MTFSDLPGPRSDFPRPLSDLPEPYSDFPAIIYESAMDIQVSNREDSRVLILGVLGFRIFPCFPMGLYDP
jgi:hypothetical protein